MEEEITGITDQTQAGARGGKSFWYCTVWVTFWNKSHHVCDLYVCITAEE